MWNKRILPISLLSGAIIGAGVFYLPFVFQRTGIFLGAVFAVLFCSVAIAIFSMYADLLGRNKHLRYTGIMRTYFGKKGYYAAFLIDSGQLFLGLTVYLILSVSFFELIVPGYSPTLYAVVFWILGSVALFVRNKREAIEEFLALVGMLVIIVVLGALGFEGFASSQGSLFSFSWGHVLLPFGVLLFAFNGRSVIPDLLMLTKGDMPVLKRAVVWGPVVPLVLYLFFVVGIVGLSPVVSPDAVSGLVGHVPSHVLFGIGLLGLLAIWGSYVAIGENLRRTLRGDIGLSRTVAGLSVISVPLFLYVLGLNNFMVLVGIVGGLLTATEWSCIAVMWRKSFTSRMSEKNVPLLLTRFSPFLFFFILAICLTAFIYTLSSFVL